MGKDKIYFISQELRMRQLALLFAVVATVACYRSYHGHQVLRTEKLSHTQYEVLSKYHIESNLDFWREPLVGQAADIMVPARMMSSVSQWLEQHNIKFSVHVQDVQKLLEMSQPSNTSARGTFDWTDYYPHEDLNTLISGWADANADFARIINIGQSYEGRDMNVLAIEKAGPGKPNVWLESGIHAREWISPAVATYIVNELVSGYASHPEYLDNINWYFLPSANPDGYAYTFDSDRLWRKTRSPQRGGCVGVDPNRNWDFHWGETGVSSNPCTEVFPGEEAFSEIEMRNIRDFVMSLETTPVLSQCFHSYSQLWLWPYGYDYGAYPENWQELEQLAIDACDALQGVHGTIFDPINSADLYPASGAADDWYKGVLGSRFAFTVELRDTGNYGFVLPKEQIIPSGEEMWAAFQVVIAKLLSL